jgi:anthranilate phosphoribosyltransferase
MDIQTALGLISEKQDLSTEEMVAVMRQIMSAGASDVQIGAFLLGLRMKGETIDEIAGGVQVLREFASGVQVSGPHLVDIVGTGGDGANLFNVSTAACFVVAAAGGRVAKHGNRSVSSSSGSADVLEAAGVKLDISPEQVTQCVNELGVGFMFALMHHSAMRHVSLARKELGMRTVFNILAWRRIHMSPSFAMIRFVSMRYNPNNWVCNANRCTILWLTVSIRPSNC